MRRESMHPRGFVLFVLFSLLGRVRGVGLFGFLGFPSCSHQVLTLFLIQVLKLFPKFSFCSCNMFPIASHVSHMLCPMLSFWNIWTWTNLMPYFCVCFEWMHVHWNLGDIQSFPKKKIPVLLLIKHEFVLNWTSPVNSMDCQQTTEEKFLDSIDSRCGSVVRISAGSNWDIWHSEHGMSCRLTISVEYVSIIIYYRSEILGA
jgi:hypothetical protein